MYDKVYAVVQSVDDFVWGWGMIALLLGTHIFLTIRTGFIQRKSITKGIPLSVAKEDGADGLSIFSGKRGHPERNIERLSPFHRISVSTPRPLPNVSDGKC